MQRTVLSIVVVAFLLAAMSSASFADAKSAKGDSTRAAAASKNDEKADDVSNRGSKLLEKLKQKLKNKLEQLWSEVEKSVYKEDYETAISKLEEILSLDEDSKEAKDLLEECQKKLKEQKRQQKLEQLWNEVEEAIDKEDYETAIPKLEEILIMDAASRDASQLLKECQKNHQRQWQGTKAGERKVIKIKDVEFAFRWCPAGKFTMGSPSEESGRYDNEKQHEVTLTKGFWMLETEVTQKQWKAIMGNNPSYLQGDDLPVENVSWDNCQAFCKKCKELGLPVQLPTEAQWEYACRAGSKTAYFWGNALNGDKANCMGTNPCGTDASGKYLGKITSVGSYDANAWGLFDMHGNVWEWCQDWYEEFSSDSVTDPTGASKGSSRVIRGGGWNSFAKGCRSAYRDNCYPGDRDLNMGFRVMRSL